LHACVFTNGGHARPPFLAGVTTARVCVMVPPPQAVEHVEKAEHAVTTHASGRGGGCGGGGHARVLHACCSLNDGHAVPPKASSVTTVRLRVWVPPLPQDTVHCVHADQALTTQLTGHRRVLQGWVCERTGQPAPP